VSDWHQAETELLLELLPLLRPGGARTPAAWLRDESVPLRVVSWLGDADLRRRLLVVAGQIPEEEAGAWSSAMSEPYSLTYCYWDSLPETRHPGRDALEKVSRPTLLAAFALSADDLFVRRHAARKVLAAALFEPSRELRRAAVRIIAQPGVWACCVAARAEEIFEQRSACGQPGDSVADWLRAEAELSSARRAEIEQQAYEIHMRCGRAEVAPFPTGYGPRQRCRARRRASPTSTDGPSIALPPEGDRCREVRAESQFGASLKIS